jgi:hypothetical protein
MMIGYLAMIMDPHERQMHLDLAELRDYCALTRALLPLAGTPGRAPGDDRARELLEHGSAEVRDATHRLVLDHSARQLLRERAWIVNAGFELEPDKLPPIDTLLAE